MKDSSYIARQMARAAVALSNVMDQQTLESIRGKPAMKIRCAICDKHVDRVEWYEHSDMSGIVIRVFCHGDQDQMLLSKEFVVNGQLNLDSLPEGTAFTTKRIGSDG